MCGICGYTGAVVPGLMNRMLDRMQHRGPDDKGDYFDQRLHLGSTRLSIIDLSGGHQPISNEEGTVWVIFNGEVYNYLELRDELEAKGHCFKTFSDTETIVHGYEEFGISVAQKLNGMFSIAIWDTRNQRLFLLRDRFGVKPLFYSIQPDTLVFASEIKTLLCHPAISRELNDEALSHYLSLRYVPAPLTIYKEIRALPPGEMLVWDQDGIKLSKWYELRMRTEWTDQDEETLVDLIDELLHDSVRLRLRSDVSFGAYLSGGIDSSTVVGIMSKYSAQPVKTFTLTFADSPVHKRDAYYARLLADRYSTEHHECTIGWFDFQNELRAVIRHLDQPFAGVISSFWLSRFMRQYVKVALSGDGADDMFGSYGHHRLVWPIVRLRKALEEGVPADNVDLRFLGDKKDLALDLVRYDPWEWRLSYAAFMEHEKSMLFSKRGRDRLMTKSTADLLKRIYKRCGSEVDELNKMLYLDLNSLLPNEILYYSDMLSMAHSLEVRTPFLDYRLVELACSIPGTLKIRNLTLKYILRRVAARYAPAEILARPKEGFVLPKNSWLRQEMASVVKQVLSQERLAIHGYFEPLYIDSLVARFFAGDDSLTFKIYDLMVFQIWYEDYLGV
jgi:asparagine synthase (glutamine-hydrolysing)